MLSAHCYQCAVIMNFMFSNEIPINLSFYDFLYEMCHLNNFWCVCVFFLNGAQTLSRTRNEIVMRTGMFITSGATIHLNIYFNKS